ncbi:MAG: glycosyltransferase family 2 protein [Candidatus Edwardsbacteria bacterium]
MNNEFPLVYIVILNWNNWWDTLECVSTLEETNYPNFKILIVDNGSSNDSVERLRSARPQLPILIGDTNVGFAQGNNLGIRWVMERDADYVFLLNNDTVVDSRAIDELTKVAESDGSIGVVSPKIFYYSSPETFWFVKAKVNLKTGLVGYHQGKNQKDRGQFDREGDIERASGCAMMVKRKVVEEIGLFDANYFCYLEEVDWCIRCREAGFRITYVPQAKVWHKVASSRGGEKSAEIIYYCVRNTLYLVTKFLPFEDEFRENFRKIVIIFLHLLMVLRLRIKLNAGIKEVFYGVKDFHRGRLGKRR